MPSRIHKKVKSKSKSLASLRKSKTKSKSRRSRSRRGTKNKKSKSRRGGRRQQQQQQKQQGGFWLKDLIFGRKTKYSNVMPAEQARNVFLRPYKELESAGEELLKKHKEKEETLAQLEKALEAARANVQSTAGNDSNLKELQKRYREAAKVIVDEYNRTSGVPQNNKNVTIEQLRQQVKQLQGSCPLIKI